jgi:hypothetical protein
MLDRLIAALVTCALVRLAGAVAAPDDSASLHGAGTWLLAENIDSVFAVAERLRPWLLRLTAASMAFAFALLVLKRPQHA